MTQTPPTPTPFPRTLILGLGLLGTSLGLALKARHRAAHITGVGRANSASLQTALNRQAIDEASTDLAAAAQSGEGADLVILCTPIRQFPAAFRTLAPLLKPGAIITDVGSTKAQIMQWAAEILPPHIHFVGSHPMAGSEKRGPVAARQDLFEGAVCLVCVNETNSEFKIQNSELPADRIAALWSSLGMRILRTDPATHDRWVAAISHLPHALAFTLVNAAAADPACLQAIAGGFLDTTRIAASDIDMWTDIFLTNSPALTAALTAFEGRLANLRQAISRGDEPAIRAALTAAKRVRDTLTDPRRKSAE